VARRRDRDGTPEAEPGGDNGRGLRTLALIAVVIGLVALTTAACVLSYASVHAFALRADVSLSLARIYPYICDAMLVLAGCSVLALRGAGLISRMYGWLCFIALLGALAASSVAHNAGLTTPKRAAEVTVAVLPWALVLVAFGLLLALLRHARRRRLGQRAGAPIDGVAVARAALEAPALEPAALEPAALEPAAGQQVPFQYVEFGHGDFQPAGTEPEAADLGEFDPSFESYDPITHESTPDQVSPTVPLPRPAEDAEERPAEAPGPPRVVQPAEMQLRARTQRQAERTGEPDTVPNPVNASTDPGVDPPAELDRPHSSPTPPTD